MRRKGYDTRVCCLTEAKSYRKCLEALLLRQLGFYIDYKKTDCPTHEFIFLGIKLSSNIMILSIPEEKLVDIDSSMKILLYLRESPSMTYKVWSGCLIGSPNACTAGDFTCEDKLTGQICFESRDIEPLSLSK